MLSETAKKFVLDALYFSGGFRLLEPRFAGLGAILMFHRVAPPGTAVFNREMYVTPDFLDAILTRVRGLGWEIVDLNEVSRRLSEPDRSRRRFVCFTFDDGYRDNMTLALPVFRRHAAPMTIYVCTGLVDRAASFWWGGLEEVVASNDTVDVSWPGLQARLPASTGVEKERAYKTLANYCHRDIVGSVRLVADLLSRYRIDDTALVDQAMLSWRELTRLAADPLVSLQAHTVSHRPLAQLEPAAARREIIDGKTTLEQRVDRPITHFAYPYGSAADCAARDFALAAEAGFKTATTTRKGNVFADHQRYRTALPRIPIGSKFDAARHVRVHLSGASAALLNRFAPVVTA